MATDFDQRIAALAASQHGVFTRAQAREIALSCNLSGVEGALRHRVSVGRWERCQPGVLQIAGTPRIWLTELTAAWLARPGSVVSHQSAGVLHRMRYVPRNIVSLIGVRSTRGLPGVIVHQPRRGPGPQVVTIGGLTVTDRATTVIDLAAVLGPQRFERVLDDQLSSHLVVVDELVTAFERQARRGKNGVALARRLLEARLGGLAASESELEHLFRELIAPHLPVTPIYQFRPSWRTEAIGRVDAAFPDQNLLVELDGRRWHMRDADVENDHRRDQEATEHHWRTVRYTYHQITTDAASVIRNLCRSLEPAA